MPGPQGGSVAAWSCRLIMRMIIRRLRACAGTVSIAMFTAARPGSRSAWRIKSLSIWRSRPTLPSITRCSPPPVWARAAIKFTVRPTAARRGSTPDLTPYDDGFKPLIGLSISPDYSSDHTIYALGTTEMYKSTNGGLVFTRMTGWYATHHVTAWAFSPAFATDHTLFAAVQNNGIMKSINGGGAWSPTSFGRFLHRAGRVAQLRGRSDCRGNRGQHRAHVFLIRCRSHAHRTRSLSSDRRQADDRIFAHVCG